jgi:hypothetical protein
MSTRDTPWPDGTPSWVDLQTPDREAAWAFYRELFGWEIVDTGEEFGHYGMATVEGRNAAGLGSTMPGSDAPPAWTTYLASSDADKTVDLVKANGGTVVLDPMVIGDSGRMAVAQDPTGAFFGIWEAKEHIGSGVVNQAGAVVWNECMTRDPQQARDFYAAVFGYTYKVMEGADYTTIDGAGPGDTVGGIGAMPDELPAEIPPYWMTYFMVEDADAAAALVSAKGGQVRMGPFDTPFGRLAVVSDPQGAVFSIMGSPPAPQA